MNNSKDNKAENINGLKEWNKPTVLILSGKATETGTGGVLSDSLNYDPTSPTASVTDAPAS